MHRNYIVNICLSLAVLMVVSFVDMCFSVEYFSSLHKMTILKFIGEYFNIKSGLLIFYNIILKGVFQYFFTKILFLGSEIQYDIESLTNDDKLIGKLCFCNLL